MTGRSRRVGSTPSATPSRRRAPARGAVATVHLWGQLVGAVAEDAATQQVTFEYTDDFRAGPLEISPIKLPLSMRGPQQWPDLARVASFQGLPGVLADCLPDAFGNIIIRRYFESIGEPGRALSPVQRLLYVGTRAMGALEFRPPLDGPLTRATQKAIEVSTLVDEARRVIEGDAESAVPDIMQVGATAGGARAKALVLWDRDQNRIRSGFAAPAAGEEQWMIKFDGVTRAEGGPMAEKDFRPGPYGRIEYAYSRLARRAGIEMSPTHLLVDRDFAHFMTRRFDRSDAGRLHLHSLGGLLHLDYALRGASSYEEYFTTIRQLRLGQPAVDQAFRRLVFNLAARNQDDHVKNLAFLMHPDGQWHLAPAYDVTWSVGGQWARTHQMTVRGKDDGFTRADLLAVGAQFDVAAQGADIVDDVEAALAAWPQEAEHAGLERRLQSEMHDAFRHFGA